MGLRWAEGRGSIALISERRATGPVAGKGTAGACGQHVAFRSAARFRFARGAPRRASQGHQVHGGCTRATGGRRRAGTFRIAAIPSSFAGVRGWTKEHFPRMKIGKRELDGLTPSAVLAPDTQRPAKRQRIDGNQAGAAAPSAPRAASSLPAVLRKPRQPRPSALAWHLGWARSPRRTMARKPLLQTSFRRKPREKEEWNRRLNERKRLDRNRAGKFSRLPLAPGTGKRRPERRRLGQPVPRPSRLP